MIQPIVEHIDIGLEMSGGKHREYPLAFSENAAGRKPAYSEIPFSAERRQSYIPSQIPGQGAENDLWHFLYLPVENAHPPFPSEGLEASVEAK